MEQHSPHYWWQLCQQTIIGLNNSIDCSKVSAIAVDGTSATLLVTDADCLPLGPALMYNDARCIDQSRLIATIAPQDCAAHGPSSSLAKLLYLQQRYPQARFALHQSDWISARLTGGLIVTDENNALKLGYDCRQRHWPNWFEQLSVRSELLPRVVPPGSTIGLIAPDLASSLGLPPDTHIMAGTTDGVAAFLATGANRIGDAVTSLGSTLVVKLLGENAIFAPEFGVYSHRLGNRWLIGGASNTGGAVLLKYFSREQLNQLSLVLKPDRPTGLHYYPLTGPGERFPVCDNDMQPLLTPRPAEDAQYLQAMLEGMAAIEAQAYELLASLGAPRLTSIRTVGGGAQNQAWTRIRQHHIATLFKPTEQTQAAFGTALLAAGHIHQFITRE